ncbi:MAG: hypothetical protein E2O40_00480 [Planctomycetota bacterium]|nr:MAG: hypothetical protein E2O40_00480 [Planctomycetota bacterium]
MITFSVLATLSACADSGSVRSEWAAPFKRLGLVPVEPPNEDVRVGDLFVYPIDPEGEQGGSTRNVDRRIGAVGRWASLPVSTELDQEYANRPSLPPTPAWTEDQPWAEATTPGGESIFAPGEIPVRLRLVSIPSGARSIGTDIVETMIPSEVISLTTGEQWQDTKGITITVASAELYSLSLDALLALLVEETDDADGRGYVLKSVYRSRLPLVAQLGSGHVWVRVISEVLYVRSMDIAIDAIHLDDMEDVPPPDLTAAPKPPPEVAHMDGDPLLQPFERAVRINQLLAESGTDQTPGVVTRIVSATDSSVTLRRIWRYPIAIAVRGLTLEVQSGTGEVVRIGTLGEPWPNRPLSSAPAPAAEN